VSNFETQLEAYLIMSVLPIAVLLVAGATIAKPVAKLLPDTWVA